MKITLFDFVAKGMKAQAEINKLCRTNDPQTSKNAAVKMVTSGALNQQLQNVYDAILMWTKYEDTFTTKDIASCISWCPYYKAYDICRRRFSGLRDKGKIELTGDRRDGC